MSFLETCPETYLKTCPETCLKTCPETYLKTCPETCLKTCPETCLKTCPETCLKTCPETCLKTCPETYLKTCPETCLKTCPETCSETCLKTSTCSFTFPKPCPDTCLKTCYETCSTTCSEICPKPRSFTCPETCVKTSSETCSFSFAKTYPEKCLRSCSKTSLITCPETSLKSCSETSSFTFPKSANDTCLKTCPETSTIGCPDISSDTSSKSCSFTSPKTCNDICLKTCPKTCTISCPDISSDTSSKTCSFTSPKTCNDICLKTCPKTCTISCPKTSSKTPKPCSFSDPKSSFGPFSKTCSTSSNSIILPRRCGTVTPKAHSVYGCGFGGRTRISSCSYRSNTCFPCSPYRIDGDRCYGGLYSGGHSERFGAKIMFGGRYGKDFLQKTEKATMQNLNDRLASYLDKVRFLEDANATLERQIREYYEKKGPICQRDYSAYLNTIDCLQEKIKEATTTNGKILLGIDNSKLAAEDFRIKYENELSIRQCLKADIKNLRCILEKTCLTKADLETQICSLQEELVYLKKTHQEDVAAQKCQLTNTKVCVEVDAAPQQDLKKVLDDIRCHYETIIDKHCKEQECWFKEKMAGLCKGASTNTESLETSVSHIIDLRRTLQNLEIELQSQISMKGALECSLLETEDRFGAMLACFQKQINNYEPELCQVRTGIEQQGKDYATLLDIKSRLEKEIATYRCLLENQDTRPKK